MDEDLVYLIEIQKLMEAADVPTSGRRLHDGEKVIAASCDYPGCEFVAKSEFGLRAHQRKHKRSKVS